MKTRQIEGAEKKAAKVTYKPRGMDYAEQSFMVRMRGRGVDIQHEGSETAQCVEHYDFLVNGVKVEFKSIKSIYHNPWVAQIERLLVEWQAVEHEGVLNNLGWVRGTSEWVVFREFEGDLWVKRSGLESLVSGVDWVDFSLSGDYSLNYKAFRRLDWRKDRRPDRDDLFCYVPRVDVLGIAGTKIVLDSPERLLVS
jgi:hypothetical protein